MSWTYQGDDPGLTLFSACLSAGAPMVFTPGMRVLEIGCAEADWLSLAREAWPEIALVGIDTRAKDAVDGTVTRRTADARDPDLFQPESFDAVVSLSAIEHIGLGHYGDPVDPDGDSKAVANVWRWLKPGGWFYFDVPYNPKGYEVRNTECRVYDDAAIFARLVPSQWAADGYRGGAWDGYVAADAPGVLIPKPTEPHRHFWYAAHVWRKG